MDNLNDKLANIKLGFNDLQQDILKKIFNRIDPLSIKQGVDKLGIDRFIDRCAQLSATTGIISGSGSALTMIIGVPLDLLNVLTQQVRVTIGIIYSSRNADYQISFDEFISIITTALEVDAGITITKNVLERGTERMLIKIGPKTAIRLLPMIGGIIGGTTNYLFIKRMAASIKKMQPRYQTPPYI